MRCNDYNSTSCKSARKSRSGNTSRSRLLIAARSYLLTKRRRMVGRVEGRLRIAPKSKVLRVYRVPGTTNGIYSAVPLLLVQAILQRMSLKCHRDRARKRTCELLLCLGSS